MNKGVATTDFLSSGIELEIRQKLKSLVNTGIRIWETNLKISGWIPETLREEDGEISLKRFSTSVTVHQNVVSFLIPLLQLLQSKFV